MISGGTKFYLSAPLTQVSDVAEAGHTMKGSITKIILLIRSVPVPGLGSGIECLAKVSMMKSMWTLK